LISETLFRLHLPQPGGFDDSYAIFAVLEPREEA